MSRLQWAPMIWLTLVWCLLWGEITVANLLAGALLAASVLLVFPAPSLGGGVRVRPWPTVVLFARFFSDLVLASVQVAWLTVRPGPPPGGSVVDMRLRGDSELLQTVTAEMVALVPGSIVIDLDSGERLLTLHVLDVRTRAEAERVRHRVLAQEARVLRAFHPDPESVLDARRRRAGGSGRGSGQTPTPGSVQGSAARSDAAERSAS